MYNGNIQSDDCIVRLWRDETKFILKEVDMKRFLKRTVVVLGTVLTGVGFSWIINYPYSQTLYKFAPLHIAYIVCGGIFLLGIAFVSEVSGDIK